MVDTQSTIASLLLFQLDGIATSKQRNLCESKAQTHCGSAGAGKWTGCRNGLPAQGCSSVVFTVGRRFKPKLVSPLQSVTNNRKRESLVSIAFSDEAALRMQATRRIAPPHDQSQ